MGEEHAGRAPDWLKSIGAMMMEGLLMMLDPSRLATRLLDIAKPASSPSRTSLASRALRA
jgi:hypothetical protein